MPVSGIPKRKGWGPFTPAYKAERPSPFPESPNRTGWRPFTPAYKRTAYASPGIPQPGRLGIFHTGLRRDRVNL